MKKNYSLIDIFKLIFAIGIVAIHCNIFDNNGMISWLTLHGIFRLGVPFFFCVSGFLLYEKLLNTENDKEYIKKYIKRLFIPLIFWLIINIPIKLFEYKSNGILLIVIKLFRLLIFYPWGAMWYVLALIVSILLVYPLYKRDKLKLAVIIGSILYIFALLCNNYYFIIENTFVQKIVDIYLFITTSARNGIFEGFYFVSVGIYINKMIYDKKINNKTNLIVLIFSYILLILEIILIKNYNHKDDHSLFVMYIILIPSLIVFLQKYSLKMNTKILRNYSSGIYFCHRFILGVITICSSILNIKLSSLFIFFITMTIIILLLSILYKIDNKYINKVIK